jgi:hypothetical protein
MTATQPRLHFFLAFVSTVFCIFKVMNDEPPEPRTIFVVTQREAHRCSGCRLPATVTQLAIA